jgi:hypothetical protein
MSPASVRISIHTDAFFAIGGRKKCLLPNTYRWSGVIPANRTLSSPFCRPIQRMGSHYMVQLWVRIDSGQTEKTNARKRYFSKMEHGGTSNQSYGKQVSFLPSGDNRHTGASTGIQDFDPFPEKTSTKKACSRGHRTPLYLFQLCSTGFPFHRLLFLSHSIDS